MRARNLKPSFFTNEDLGELPFEHRLLFQGLWCIADREGFFENRPNRIAAQIFPYDRAINSEVIFTMLSRLAEKKLIKLTKDYGYIPTFLEHNNPHQNEMPSTIDPKIREKIIKSNVFTIPKLRTKVASASYQGSKHLLPNTKAIGLNPESPLMNPESPFLRAEAQKTPHIPQSQAVKVYREIFHLNPNRTQQPEIDSLVKENGDLLKWEKACKAWAMSGNKPTNIKGILDWYKNGIPEFKPLSFKPKQTKDDAFAAIDRAIEKISEAKKVVNNG